MNEITKNKNNVNKDIDLMTNVLYLYIKELNDELIKSISDTIMNNFVLYKQKMINKKLKNVFNIYKIKQQIFLGKKFSQWNKNLLSLNSNNNNNYFNLNLNVGPIINNNNNNTNDLNTENYLNKPKNNKDDINNEKNQKKNKRHVRNNNNNINIYNKSNSSPNMINNLDIISENNKKKKRPLSSEDSTYNNKSNKTNKINNNIHLSAGKNFEEKIMSQKMKRNKTSSEKIDKFIKRQEIFSKNNHQKKEKIIKDNEDEYKLIYTFEPKVNDSLRKLYKNGNISVAKRLYNDSIIRRNKQLEKDYSKSNICNNMNKKVYNQKKIIELYEDYNLRREKNKELIKKIEKECGYTYVPSILHKKNSGYCTNKNNSIQYNTSKNKNNNNKKINNDIINNNKKLKKSNSSSESFRVIKNK